MKDITDEVRPKRRASVPKTTGLRSEGLHTAMFVAHELVGALRSWR